MQVQGGRREIDGAQERQGPHKNLLRGPPALAWGPGPSERRLERLEGTEQGTIHTGHSVSTVWELLVEMASKLPCEYTALYLKATF